MGRFKKTIMHLARLSVLLIPVLVFSSCGSSGGGGGSTTTTTPMKSISVSPGDSHTCASQSDNTVRCWGDNAYGELGTDWVLPRVFNPVSVSGLTNVNYVVSGGSYSCALLLDKTASCWGSNLSGQLGDGTQNDTFTPVPVAGLTNAIAITASHGRMDSYGHTCALLSDNTVVCWGRNLVGQLGNGAYGAAADSYIPVAVKDPTNTTTLSGVVAVGAGGWHSCALLNNGTVACWGDNTYGQLGMANTTTLSSTPVVVPNISTATQIAVGAVSSCALLQNGTVQCWGNNGQGRLGNNSTTDSYLPVPVSNITNAIAITAGRGHACALLSGGAVQCWGDNSSAMLGDGTTTNSSIPVSVSGLTNAISISAGSVHTCARLTDTSVKCWGNNSFGQVGPGSTTYSATPGDVTGGIMNTQYFSAGSQHGCSLYDPGSGKIVQCWGDNAVYQLGTTAFSRSSSPTTVSGFTTSPTNLSAGGWHNCTLQSDGSIACWGQNTYGQLGNGTTTDSATPVTVSGIINYASTYYNPNIFGPSPVYYTTIAVSAGSARTCAIIEQKKDTGLCSGTPPLCLPVYNVSDSVKCWGDNDAGQLGTGTPSATGSSTPVDVTGISTAAALTGGYNHTCALLSNGTVQCWGANYSGQLGDGSLNNSSIPVSVSGITNAIALSSGNNNDHSCAILSGGLTGGPVECWGDNTFGQLGNGTTVNSSVPVTVTGITNATSVATGYGHTCALLSDNTVKCWGWNVLGQLGDGSTTNSSVPVAVKGLTGAMSITTGFTQTCASMFLGNIKCWGDNSYAQLGLGALSTSIVTPADISVVTRTSAGGQNYPPCQVTLLLNPLAPAMCVLDGNLVIRTPMFFLVIPLPQS